MKINLKWSLILSYVHTLFLQVSWKLDARQPAYQLTNIKNKYQNSYIFSSVMVWKSDLGVFLIFLWYF